MESNTTQTVKSVNRRLNLYALLLVVLFIILAVTLATLTLGKGAEYSSRSEDTRTKTLTVNGQRGEITDRNGVLLAANRKSFNIQFDRDVSKTTAKDRAMYTQSLIKAIEIIEENGGKITNELNLKRDENGNFYFDFNIENEKAFNARKEQWLKNFYFTKEDSEEDMYNKLRSRYQIPDYVDYDMAYKILSIWQEVQMNAYRSYYPVIICYDMDTVTISELETEDFYEDCIQINEDYTRVYPKGTTAAHVLGYIGKQNDEEQIKSNSELGYEANDELGITGVEATQESLLTGSTSDKKGMQEVEVNNIGKVIRELNSVPATSGDNLMLTIDYELQKKAEEALAKNIADINEEQQQMYAADKAEYDKKAAIEGIEEIRMASSGAVVVMDVKNGEILALASAPDFDPNMFIGGISTEDYKALSEDKSAPLYNKAISDGTPGSVFKMVTAVAGLMEGDVTVNETISDQGEFKDHLSDSNAKGPSCWTKTPSIHANQNVSLAIQNSCNYYFYTISYRMGVEKINKWADQLGLTSATNIELTGEVRGKVGNQEVLYNNKYPAEQQQIGVPVLVRQQLVGYLRTYVQSYDRTEGDEKLKETAEKLMKLVNADTRDYGDSVRKILHDQLNIPMADSYANSWDTEVITSLMQLQWNPNQTITTAIGQGVTTVTPVATARYVSALVNGGKVFDARLVKSTVSADGTVTEKQSQVYNTVNIDDAYITAIKQGMRNVVAHNDGVAGTAAKYFADWSEERKQMLGGKTGTAEVNSIDIEHSAWFVGFAPYDDPEIVVVVFIPNGYSGGRASYTVKEIMELYLDRREEQNGDKLSKTETNLE